METQGKFFAAEQDVSAACLERANMSACRLSAHRSAAV
jgi:hypothetical protein